MVILGSFVWICFEIGLAVYEQKTGAVIMGPSLSAAMVTKYDRWISSRYSVFLSHKENDLNKQL